MNRIVGANPIMNSTRQTGGEGRRKICHASWAYRAMHDHICCAMHVGTMQTRLCMLGHLCWSIHVAQCMLGNASKAVHVVPCMLGIHVWPFMASNARFGYACLAMRWMLCYICCTIRVAPCMFGHAFQAVHVGPWLLGHLCQALYARSCM